MKFSLVIPLAPYRNAEIISSIKDLDYPKSDFQVIVVKSLNPSENRNRGAEKAKGEIIGFLDDDAVLEKDFLKKVEIFFKENPDVDIVGGPQLTPKDEKGFAKMSGYALGSSFGAAGSKSRYVCGELTFNADERLITSANLFVKTNVMNKIKFDEKLWPGEDPKFISDAKKAGFKIAYSPEIVLFHRRRNSPRKLMKQIFNYGKVRPLKEKLTETAKMPLFLVPSLFVIYLIFLAFILFIPSFKEYFFGINDFNITYQNVILLPLLIYLILLISFSCFDSIKNKDYKAVFVLLFVYPIIHLSYGVGMIWGFIKKLLK